MAESPTPWIARALGWVRLEESAAGGATASDEAATGVSGVTTTTLLGRALAQLQLAPGEAAEAQLSALIDAARAGQPGHMDCDVDGQPVRVLALPEGPDRAEVLIAPRATPLHGAVARRAAMSDMASNVSHEVSNALSAISGWVELLREAPGDEAEQQASLERIAGCAATAQSIARRLLDVVRSGDGAPGEDIQVAEVVSEVVELLQLTARSRRVGLESSVQGRPMVHGVRADLFSAVWNLAKNAVEACEAGDQVRITLSSEGDRVSVTVADTGAGMDRTTLDRLLEPYFTTKESGTGLGMGLVRRAVGAMGGEMAVESAPGRGTEVRVSLPDVGRSSATFAPVSLRAPRQSTGRAALTDVRVLLVDDDSALREMVSTALELKGAIVTACRSASEALAVHDRFDIALIDMMLSDGRGDELLANLRRRGKVEAAMLVTGLVSRPRMVPGGEPDDWIRKPFEIGPLTDRIRQTLERHRMLADATSSVAPG